MPLPHSRFPDLAGAEPTIPELLVPQFPEAQFPGSLPPEHPPRARARRARGLAWWRARPGRTRAGVYAALLALAGTAVFLGVQGGPGPASTTVVIPPPPSVSAAAQAQSVVGVATAQASVGAAASASAKPNLPADVSSPPVAGAKYAGQVLSNTTGAALAAWNQTQSFCTQADWAKADGSVYDDRSDDTVLTTTGSPGSCVGLISPQAYSSAVIEAEVYFPPLPGHPNTIADWTSFWLTNQAAWPADCELDAVEAEPATGVNAAAWHWGAAGAEQSMSTDGFARQGTLPSEGPNLTPGWHVVDVVYTQGFFAVYYDAKLFTSLSSGVVTGAPLSLLITTSVTPDNGEVQATIGNAPQNSDSSPAGLAVKYVKVWSYK